MGFIKESKKSVWKPDSVFSIMADYKVFTDENGKDAATNAIIGSLKDEDENLVALKTVYDNEEKIAPRIKAAYPAGLKGNPEFIEAMKNWIIDGNYKYYVDGVATCGGSGAVFVGLDMCLEYGESVILPEVAWGSYKMMANEFGFNIISYNIYDVDDMLKKVEEVARKEGKVELVINSPCHNPCGLSYSLDEWNRIVNKLNEVSAYSDVILLNDVAYIDYAFDPKKAREYIGTFNKLNEKVLVLIAASCSKSFSYYGHRLGALLILNRDKGTVEEVEKGAELKVRCTWSTCNNMAMINVTNVLNNHKDEYLAEKAQYIELLRKRADLFLKEAKENGIDVYPYNEGFFITLRFEDEELNARVHEALLKKHIYTVKTVKGIRIAICSMSLKSIKGLCAKIKEVIESVR